MASRLLNSFGNVVLSNAHSRSLRISLREYRECAEATFSALLDESGSILLESGDLPLEQSATLGALANGAFIAVRELAKRLGDDACEGLHHQGLSKHFYIVPLSPVTFLFTIFGNETKLGIIRSALAKYGPVLREKLHDSTLENAESLSQEGDLVLTPADDTAAAC